MRSLLLAVLLLVVALAIAVYAATHGWLGDDETAGSIAGAPRPEAIVAERAAAQASTRTALGAPDSKQVLFGDFRVYTNFEEEH